jgi:hypothetical protein
MSMITTPRACSTTTPSAAAPKRVAGQRVQVHYTGWLHDAAQPERRGRKFDSSKDRGQPFAFGWAPAGHPRLGRRRAGHAGRRHARADHPAASSATARAARAA